MKLTILNTKNEQTGTIDLPEQFAEDIRRDIIRRAVLAIEANMRQRYGVDPRAGKKHSAELSKRRRKYRGSYGLGIARTPRKIMSRNGIRFGWVGAIAPYTRGGRTAHPPKAEKQWDQKVNKKERRRAIRAAMSASLNKQWVALRGHKVPQHFPFIVDSDFESVEKTKQFVQALTAIGLQDELDRVSVVKTRGGAAALRGRRTKKRVGPLVIVSKPCAVQRAARNVPGCDVITVRGLNAKILAPGTHAGRLALYTKDAIEQIKNNNLYM